MSHRARAGRNVGLWGRALVRGAFSRRRNNRRDNNNNNDEFTPVLDRGVVILTIAKQM